MLVSKTTNLQNIHKFEVQLQKAEKSDLTSRNNRGERLSKLAAAFDIRVVKVNLACGPPPPVLS